MGIRFEDRPFEDALTHPATWDMTDVYSSADLILCRAGASTLAELEALGIPAVVIPWMKAADGHQEKNARVFSGLTGNPVFIENSSPDAFGEVLKTVNQNTTERADLARGALALYDAMKTLAF